MALAGLHGDERLQDTVAALLERLGDIPSYRVLLKPAPGTATEEDLLRALGQPRKRICELIDGTLVEKPMGSREAILGSYLGALLWVYIRENNLGRVMGGDGPVRLMPGNVRVPDVSFIPWERMPPADAVEWIFAVTPALAVEVLSESNTSREIERKLEELFDTGCLLAWIIDPRKKTVRVHTSLENIVELDETGILDGGTVLPGFRVPVADLFAMNPRPE
jgi:Uma2 family endonuclease